MGQVVTALIDLYTEFDSSKLARLSDVYHPNIQFIDPVHRVRGLDAVSAYFQSVLGGTRSCSFQFSEPVTTGSTVVLEWKMLFVHPNLAKGKELELEGISLLKLEGDTNQEMKVVYHRDYYDLGAMVYEHVSILGAAVRYVKRKLSASD